MASFWICIFSFALMLVPCLYSSPVKRSTKVEKRELTDELNENCYGTDCFDPDNDYEHELEVKFPENFTEGIDSALQNIEASQKNMVVILNETLEMSKHQSMALMDQSSTLQSHDEQIKNMTGILANIAELLQVQLYVQIAGSYFAPKDCQDVALLSRSLRSGPYTISPQDGLGSFVVHCDMETDGGPWTIFQKRFDGSVDFYRGWEDYEQGFGNANGEYWLGLQNIRRLVSQQGTSWILRIDLEDFDSETAYAVYDSFMISDAASNYILSVGTYSGNAGDSLQESGGKRHNGMQFSTHDRDNDQSSINCAASGKGGWWYNTCYWANLNGQYLGSLRNMHWHTWKIAESLKRSEMKVKRVN